MPIVQFNSSIRRAALTAGCVRFEKLAKQLISVPKSEIDKREAEYQGQKKSGKKRRKA
jgi:hypothetical protein